MSHPAFCPSRWFLARDKSGKILGFCATIVERDSQGEVGIIDYLGVVPEARRRGLGRALLLEGARALRTAGYVRVRLATEVTNKRALALYQGVGFQIWRESRSYEMQLQR